MTSSDPGDFAQILEQLLELPPGRERDDMLASLRPRTPGDETDLYVQASRILRAADLLNADAHRAPALADDPIAAVLGLVSDDNYQLDPRSLRRAREAARFEPTTLARALAARGWKVSGRDVFNWEARGAQSVSPALVRATAEVLGTDPDQLTRQTTPIAASKPHLAVLVAKEAQASPRFESLVARFAKLQGIPAKMAASALGSRMVATVQRGEHPDADQMLASVEALIDALETPDEP